MKSKGKVTWGKKSRILLGQDDEQALETYVMPTDVYPQLTESAPLPYPFDPTPKGIEVDENKIYFFCNVGEREVLELVKTIRHLDIEMQYLSLRLSIPPVPIELHIHSGGGDIFAGLAATDAIMKCKTPIHTYVEGSVASAATLMSIAGDKRYISKNAFMLIHQLSSFMVHGKFEEFKDEMKNQESLMESIKNIYLKRTNMTKKKMEELLRHDLWLNAQECIKLGLVDEIN
jgi:ATP-dependent protease ClpP protease subunit